jgi:hypothetical protein
MDTRQEVRDVFLGITKELRRFVVLRVAGALGPDAGEDEIVGRSDSVWSRIENEVFEVVKDAVERVNEIATSQLEKR